MNRQQWKDLFEAIGFIAIIVSLVFVGIESRNSTKQAALNTQALEIAAYQELMTKIDDFNVLSLQNDRIAALMSGIWPDENDDLESFQRDRALYILFRHGDLAYFMYERGAIDEARLLSALAIVPIESQIGLDFWAARKGSFTEGYIKYVDHMTAKQGER
jgi:hypothetical protein